MFIGVGTIVLGRPMEKQLTVKTEYDEISYKISYKKTWKKKNLNYCNFFPSFVQFGKQTTKNQQHVKFL